MLSDVYTSCYQIITIWGAVQNLEHSLSESANKTNLNLNSFVWRLTKLCSTCGNAQGHLASKIWKDFLLMCHSLMKWLKYGTGSKGAYVALTSRIRLWRIPGVKLLSALSHPSLMQASLQFAFYFERKLSSNLSFLPFFSRTITSHIPWHLVGTSRHRHVKRSFWSLMPS